MRHLGKDFHKANLSIAFRDNVQQAKMIGKLLRKNGGK